MKLLMLGMMFLLVGCGTVQKNTNNGEKIISSLSLHDNYEYSVYSSENIKIGNYSISYNIISDNIYDVVHVNEYNTINIKTMIDDTGVRQYTNGGWEYYIVLPLVVGSNWTSLMGTSNVVSFENLTLNNSVIVEACKVTIYHNDALSNIIYVNEDLGFVKIIDKQNNYILLD